MNELFTSEVFSTFALIVALIVTVTGFLGKLFYAVFHKPLKPIVKQVLAWVISLIVVGIGIQFQFGLFKDFTFALNWLQYIFIAFGAGLAANGFYDIGAIRSVLLLLRILPDDSPKEATRIK